MKARKTRLLPSLFAFSITVASESLAQSPKCQESANALRDWISQCLQNNPSSTCHHPEHIRGNTTYFDGMFCRPGTPLSSGTQRSADPSPGSTTTKKKPDAAERSKKLKNLQTEAAGDDSLDPWAKKKKPKASANSAAKRQNIDPTECVSLYFKDRVYQPYTKSTLYNFEAVNSCKKSHRVTLVTNGGDEASFTVNPYSTYNWQCADNFKGRKNCKGGIRTWKYN